MWLSGVDRKPCDECKAIWKSYDRSPPCETCRPEVHQDNIVATEVYSLVSDQWIVSHSGLIGIRITAIKTALKMLKIHKADLVMVVMKIKRITGVIIRITSEKKD